jgi:hypothetical protein
LGVQPYLQHTPFQIHIRCLTGFAARTRIGFYGQGPKVQSSTVSSAITAIGQTIAMACNDNPTKVVGLEKFLPALQVMIEAYSKEDPPTRKMLLVEVDMPELLVEMGYGKPGTLHAQAIGDLALIAFYYLLRVGKYMAKGKRNNIKQTVQFKFKDVSFFKWNKAGILVCLPWDAPPSLIMMADISTLKLDNQKNGWKCVCVHQEANKEWFNCPVRASAHHVLHLQNNGVTSKTLLSLFFHNNKQYNVCGEDISRGLKMAATLLQYPATWGIPIERVNTHSLQSGGANVLALSGYSNTQILKMGHWKGATSKEYIREELACYSAGMTRDMKRNFKFVNIA